LEADVYGEKDGRKIAVEVALSSDKREIQHIKDRLEDVDQVYTAAVNKKVKQKLQEKLEGTVVDQESATVFLISELPDQEFS
jgi:hypothetical protein